MSIHLPPEEIERRTRFWLEWSGQFDYLLMRLHTIGFKGYVIKDNQVVDELIDPICQKEIDLIHGYIKSKAKELRLI